MKTYHAAVAVFALASLAALPACSNWRHENTQTSSATPPSQQELSPGMVKQVQTALQQQGDYNGNIDGVWGPATQQGVATYQQQHNMTASGQLTPDTLAALNVQPGGAAGQTSSNAPPPATSNAPPQTSSSASPQTSNNAPPPSANPEPQLTGNTAGQATPQPQPANGGTTTQ